MNDIYRVMIIMTILLFSLCANRAQVRNEREIDFSEITKYGIVSFSRIGIAGTYTGAYRNIWQIAQDIDAENQFTNMIEEPALDTKLYALMGLKIINSDKYIGYREKLSTIKTALKFGGGGCVIEAKPVNEIVELIDRYQMREPDAE